MSHRTVTVPLIVTFHLLTLGIFLVPHLMLAVILRLGRPS